MYLYLMRHGQAADISVDPEQGLTQDGRRAIEGLANKLTQQPLQVDHVFHSTKTRAQQTAEIMAAVLSPEVKPRTHDHLKPGDDPAIMEEIINQWSENTLIVSHLPFIPNLLNLLTQDTQSIPFVPGTLVCLHKNGAQWHINWIKSP